MKTWQLKSNAKTILRVKTINFNDEERKIKIL